MNVFKKYLENSNNYKTSISMSSTYNDLGKIIYKNKKHFKFIENFKKPSKLSNSFIFIYFTTAVLDIKVLKNILGEDKMFCHYEYGEGFEESDSNSDSDCDCITFIYKDLCFDIDHRGTSLSYNHTLVDEKRFKELMVELFKKYINL